MKPSLFFLFFAFVLTTAWGDIEIHQVVEAQMEGVSPKHHVVVRAKGTALRMDIDDTISMIIDSSQEGITSLSHHEKAAITIPKSAITQMSASLVDENTEEHLKASDFQPTGKKDTIAGMVAEEYVAKKGSSTAVLWLAKDFPNLKDVQKLMDNLGKMRPEVDQAFSYGELSGFPVKSEITQNGQTFKVVVESVKDVPLPDTYFKVPADYQQMTMPTIPGHAP